MYVHACGDSGFLDKRELWNTDSGFVYPFHNWIQVRLSILVFGFLEFYSMFFSDVFF